MLRKLGDELLRRGSMQGTWIDVGAHNGEHTKGYARLNPALRIYAFEPNLRVAASMIGHAPNFVVIPMAVAEQDGSAEFHINAHDQASSLLPLNERGVRSWIGGEPLRVESVVTVPAIRLDTFLRLMHIPSVDFLKIDAQGADLGVLKSAGDRLRDIHNIVLEVSTASQSCYLGAPSKQEVLAFLDSAGFSLVKTEPQSHGQEENLSFTRISQDSHFPLNNGSPSA